MRALGSDGLADSFPSDVILIEPRDLPSRFSAQRIACSGRREHVWTRRGGRITFVNIAALRVAALFLAFAVQAFGQEPESLWTPPGYRLLTVEERQSLPADELKAIGTRNGELLARALGSMTPEERDALPLSLKHFAETHTLSLPERQYVVQLQMRIASMKEQERLAPETEERKRRYEKLLVEQEASRGFASDQESIEREAYAIGELVQNGDARALYLRALKPLRARPWNNPIRHVFSRIVRSDPVRPQNTSLYDAALVFLHAREKENPEEGAWVSLEAYFRLVLRQEVDESRRLFDVAIAKGSKDVESHLYPILIAEMEGDSARVARLRPRSAKEWPKPGELDRELFYAIDDLPHEIGSRVRATFGKKFKSAYPAEWPARVQSMEDAILDAERKEQRGDPAARAVTAAAIEREATILLQLPLSALPEPSRTDVFALQLRSRSDGGRCHEVMAEIPRLERAAERAYPKAWDPNAEPVPRTLAEVAALRASLPKEEAFFERLKAAVADGSVVKWVELDDVAAGERLEAAHEIVAAVESGIREARELLSGRTDSEGAAEL